MERYQNMKPNKGRCLHTPILVVLITLFVVLFVKMEMLKSTSFIL